MLRKGLIVVLVLLSVLLSGIAIFAIVVFNRPELMPPGPYHPRALVCQLLGYRVHPWVKIDPTKEYTLKIWSSRWPIFHDGYGYDDLIEEVIEEFRQFYTNVNVEYVLLPLDEIEEAITRAVENSTPPNICIGPFDPSLINSGLVVPINMFICDKPREDIKATPAAAFESSSLESVSFANRLWAWPSWIEVESWAGNAELLRAVGVDVERVMLHGWSYQDVLTMVDALRMQQTGVTERHRTYGLVLFTTSTYTLDTLMKAAGSGLLFSDDGSLLWQGEILQSCLSFLEDIRTKNGFPEPVHMMDDKMLELFWTGRAAVIGPVGPGFLRHVSERQDRITKGDLSFDKEAIEPVLLPIPHPTGREGCSCITLHAATVFACPDASETDGAYLAVRLAETLARKEALWLASQLPVVPARIEGRQYGFGLTVPDGAGWRFLMGAATSGMVCRHLSAEIKEKERQFKEQAISPLMADFWRGVVMPHEFDRRLSACVEDIPNK